MSGTERGFACLGHDTISVNLLRSWIKRNQSTGREKKKQEEKTDEAEKEVETRTMKLKE